MSWLQKRPQVSNPTMFYTVGLNRSVLLVGLGNIGNEYIDTRHNIGFQCLDTFILKNEDMSAWILKKDLKCHFSSGRIGDTRVIAIKPTTLMNDSGTAVRETSNFYKIGLDHIVVVHDELDIEFGQIRLRIGGDSAGHNGIKSIIQNMGEEFGRIRIGIGPKKPARIDSANFVLQQFNDKEKIQLPNLKKEVAAVLSEYVFSNSTLPIDTRSFLL